MDGDWDERPVAGEGVGRVTDGRVDAPTVIGHADEPLASLARAAHAETTILVPLRGALGDRGDLAVFIDGSALFVDDDLAVLSILGSRTIATIERDEALEERSALIATLRRTNEELAGANAAKSDFLAAMSHELRTPLNAILGFSELLMAPGGPADRRRGFDVVDQAGHIHGAGLQLLDLVNEVLDLARIEAGRLDLHYDRFDLGGLVRRSVESMGPAADRAQVTFALVTPDDAQVDGDPARVRQVVSNLLSNAVKFSPPGGIVTVEVAFEAETASVSVSDEGPGIPAEEQGEVFEAFAQGHQGRLRADGAGLGLALSQQLAEAHRGRIDLVSEPPGGSRFTFRLPTRRPVPMPDAPIGVAEGLAEAAAPSTARQAMEPDDVSRGADPCRARRSRMTADRVLLVEDDERSAELIRLTLEPTEFELRASREPRRGTWPHRRWASGRHPPRPAPA